MPSAEPVLGCIGWHPNFLRLMVDMEIFIDQIADMRVNQMNLILEATRQTILKEHAPWMKVIKALARWRWRA